MNGLPNRQYARKSTRLQVNQPFFIFFLTTAGFTDKIKSTKEHTKICRNLNNTATTVSHIHKKNKKGGNNEHYMQYNIKVWYYHRAVIMSPTGVSGNVRSAARRGKKLRGGGVISS